MIFGLVNEAWGPLGVFQGPLGRPFETFWRPLESLWGVLGAIRGHLRSIVFARGASVARKYKQPIVVFLMISGGLTEIDTRLAGG